VFKPLTQQDALRYIRAKIDQLLGVMGTLPLRPEELDDATLLELDPIGIIADSFEQVITHLNETNHRLSLATREIRTILDTLGAAVVVLDPQDCVEDFNRVAGDWFFGGAAREAIVGRVASEVCGCAEAINEIRRVADSTVHNANLHGRDVQIVATKILDEAGLHAKTVMLFTDITLQKETERSLRLYSEVFRQVGEGILITDAETRIVELNAAVSRILGYSREELLGTMPRSLKSGLHEPPFYEELWRQLDANGHWQGEIYDRVRDGRVIPLLQTISAVRDADGRVSHYIAVMADISSIKERQSRLDFLAHHDVLTELPNRLLFGDRLDHAIDRARRDSETLALLFIDLDRFKDVNDNFGHHVGDQLLIQVAARLKELVRRADTVARLGGDEFVVLMEGGADRAAADMLADKITAAFTQDFPVAGKALRIGCSIGVAVYPANGDDAAALLGHADDAMYRAKVAGRG
jgi:diguanylate cyclase (GGDEF)-like protein/PAS domain S-box-containing protein